MDIISLIMLILGVLGILGGFLYGKRRGLSKAVARLIIIGAAMLVAFFIKDQITETILTTPVDEGKSIIDLITEGMTEGEGGQNMEGFVNIIKNILTMAIQIFVFIFLFIGIRFGSLIIFWIICAIISLIRKNRIRDQVKGNLDEFENGRKLSRKQIKLLAEARKYRNVLEVSDSLSAKEEKHVKKHLAKVEKKLTKKTAKRERMKWWGSLVGVIQGAIIVMCVMGPVSGLVSDLSGLVKSLSEMEIEGETMIDKETDEMLEELGVYGYSETGVAKVYNAVGGWLYRSISTVENEDGTTTNIQSQIGAIDGGIKMIDIVARLTEVNMDDGFTSGVKDEIVSIFTDLDAVKDEMNEESVRELDRLMKEALAPLLSEGGEEFPIDLDSVNFAEVDFETEGEVISSFYDLYQAIDSGEDISEDQIIEDVVTTLSDSTLILPVLSQMIEDLPEEDKPSLSEEEKEKVEEVLDGLENQENVEEIRNLFGI